LWRSAVRLRPIQQRSPDWRSPVSKTRSSGAAACANAVPADCHAPLAQRAGSEKSAIRDVRVNDNSHERHPRCVESARAAARSFAVAERRCATSEVGPSTSRRPRDSNRGIRSAGLRTHSIAAITSAIGDGARKTGRDASLIDGGGRMTSVGARFLSGEFQIHRIRF
jgi:hypothetical protein